VCSSLYFLGLLVSIIVGAVGPTALQEIRVADRHLQCYPTNNCTATNPEKAIGLDAFNQFIYWTVSFDRPTYTDDSLVLPNVDYSTSFVYTLQIQTFGNDNGYNALAPKSTHMATMTCPKHSVTCDGIMAFYLNKVTFQDIVVVIAFIDPLKQWTIDAGDEIKGFLGVHHSIGTVNPSYTTFQLGWRYFFVAASFLFASFHVYAQWCGPGSRDHTGKRLTTAMEQRWVAAMSILLIFFNDPLFAYTVLNPSFAAAGFSAFCTVTFVTVVLIYWLVHFHLAAIQSEVGVNWSLDQDGMNNLGLLFWIPKIILGTAFWIAAFSFYMWSRYQQISDPAYSLFESMPAIGQYFTHFLFALGGIYFLYVFALLVLACRHCRKLKSSNIVFLFLTLVTLIIFGVGIFLNVFSTARSTAISFLVVYATANFYVWFLQFSFLPKPNPDVAASLTYEVQQPVDTGVFTHHDDLDVNVDDVVLAPSVTAGSDNQFTGARGQRAIQHEVEAVNTTVQETDAHSFVVAEDDDDDAVTNAHDSQA
jgi:hypothetical protein